MLDHLDAADPLRSCPATAAPPTGFTPALGGASAPLAADDRPRGALPWQTALTVGDILLFAFPVRLPFDGEKPRVRPCLVLDMVELPGHRYALLAYGISAVTTAHRGYEITVATAAEALAAGLARYTRFDGARRLLVSLDHPDFRPRRTSGSPVIGRLGPKAMARLHQVRGRLHAEADIAAERRAEARRERQERQGSGHASPGRRMPARPVVAQRRPHRFVDASAAPSGCNHRRPSEPRINGRLGLSTSTTPDGAPQ